MRLRTVASCKNDKNMLMTPRIKICCIANREEARLAIDSGASAIGLVSAMPRGPGPIDENEIAHIIEAVPPPIATFLLTSQQSAPAIIAQQKRTRANTLQLVDSLPLDQYTQLHAELPGIKIVQVIHVVGQGSVEEALTVAPYVDALLLDSGNPSLAVKELGGTGRVHDWEISRAIREAVAKPLFLAGGLNAENAAQAIAIVQPFGVDICSGVRTNGRLDAAKLAAYVAAVQGK